MTQSDHANATAHSELAQEAQSEAPSVDEIYDSLEIKWIKNTPYIQGKSEIKAKINHLITEARIDELKRISKFKGLEWPSTARATYIENRIKELK